MQGGNVVTMTAKVRPRPPALIDVSKRLQAMELNLLSSVNLSDVARSLNGGYRKLLGFDVVSLMVFEREHQDFALTGGGDDPALHVVEHACVPAYTQHLRAGVWLGRYREELHARFFPRKPRSLQTIALLPLSRRAKVVGVLALGTFHARFQPSPVYQERLNRLAAIVAVAVETLYNREHIRQVSLRDPLTGLYNRRYFTEHLNRVIAKAARNAWSICCLYLDIDHFKSINDRYGHAVGDFVLCEFGQRVAGQLRSGEVLARIGGEEFCVLLTEATKSTGVLVAERIRHSIQASAFVPADEEQIALTVSCGIAASNLLDTSDSRSASNALLDRADRALYLAKQRGRNRVVAS